MSSIPDSRSFALNTYDITQQVISNVTYVPAGWSNTVGTASPRMTKVVWKNIDLRRLLGDMFYTYRQFNLVTRTLTVGNCDNIGSQATDQLYDDRNWVVMMSGDANPTFHWTHNYHLSSTIPNTMMPVATYSTVNVGASEGFTQFYSDNFAASFDTQGSYIIDIAIHILRASDLNYLVMNNDTTTLINATSPTSLPNWQMMFDIVPVLSSKIDKSNLRT